MLLRRITEHVKAQNWFAVGLDFLIVVVGVFIGIQVSNWNDARAERGLEARTIERLESEVDALIRARAGRRQFAVSVRDGLDEAMRNLFGIAPESDLSLTACRAIVLSHVYASQPDELPVIEELTATGRIDVIQNAQIKRPLLNFIRARDHGRSTLPAVGRDIHKMSHRHPDLIRVEMTADNDSSELVTRMHCEAKAMRRNQGFLNELIGNHALHSEYFQSVFESVDPELKALQTELKGQLDRRDQGANAR